MPLVDGSGNFGSIDGDNAAAMRYTECRMSAIATEVLTDLGSSTVPYKPNYDGSRDEPWYCQAAFPICSSMVHRYCGRDGYEHSAPT